MGLFSFVKDAGSAIFGANEHEITEASKPLSQHVRDSGIDPSNLKFKFSQGNVIATGWVASQEEKEKVVMIIGNVQGVGGVDDQITVGEPQVAVAEPAPAAEAPVSAATEGGDPTPADWQADTYTVQSGDTLGGIAKKVYGSAGKYMAIFEANTPMLKDPNKIYPGQVLRIPPLS